MSKEVYISIDVETDGPIPGEDSMWSLGAATFLTGGSPYYPISDKEKEHV